MMRKTEKRNKRKLMGALLLCLLLITGCGVPDKALVLTTDAAGDECLGEEQSSLTVETQDASETAEDTIIYIHVCGAVQCPGVVEVPLGSRVADALQAAGGLQEDASADYINLAAKLEDAQQLYFPTEEEACEWRMQESEIASGLVDINTADAEHLCTLPGIGASRAAEIIAYREQSGGFQCKEDIMQVPGIKENAYNKLRDYIIVKENK